MTQQKQNRLKKAGSWRWIAVVIACLGGGWALLRIVPTPAQKAFAWFGRLGFPDVKGRKYVKVATGAWSQSGNQRPEISYTEGFLLSESNGTFTVFLNDLSVKTFQKTPRDTLAYKAVGFEILDLKSNAMARLTTPNFLYGFQVYMGRQMPEEFFLGWACERNGLHKLAEDLYRKAVGNRSPPLQLRVRSWQDIRNYAESLSERWKKPPFIHELENEIGQTMMWRAMLAFQDVNTSRADLLHKFEEIVEKYPHCKHVPDAKENVSILRKMLSEDEAHARKDVKALADMSREERIAELVFQLREQNGRQWSDPGSCDIFQDPKGTNSPASQLVELGYDAVPALLGAVESKEFSRSVGWQRSFYYSHYVLSIGDCAIDILERIAARDFHRAGYAKATNSKEQIVAARKAAAQAWWLEFKQKGEKAMLVEGTERGDDDSPAQAALLIKTHPQEAVAAVPVGAQRATNSWVRSRLVELTDSIPFLKEEVRHGPTLPCRLAAAKRLHLLRLADGVDAMIEEWNNANPKSSDDEEFSFDGLAEFLVSSGKVKAIETLSKGLNARPIRQRLAVIEATNREGSEGSLPSAGGSPKKLRPHDAPEDLDDAVERLLAQELEDAERYVGMGGSWGDKTFNDPRMCDLAAHILWKRWPQKYFFDLNASEAERESQRMECLNRWRAQNKLGSAQQ